MLPWVERSGRSPMRLGGCGPAGGPPAHLVSWTGPWWHYFWPWPAATTSLSLMYGFQKGETGEKAKHITRDTHTPYRSLPMAVAGLPIQPEGAVHSRGRGKCDLLSHALIPSGPWGTLSRRKVLACGNHPIPPERMVHIKSG